MKSTNGEFWNRLSNAVSFGCFMLIVVTMGVLVIVAGHGLGVW